MHHTKQHAALCVLFFFFVKVTLSTLTSGYSNTDKSQDQISWHYYIETSL